MLQVGNEAPNSMPTMLFISTSNTRTLNAIDITDIILTIASKIIKPLNISARGTIGRVCKWDGVTEHTHTIKRGKN